METKAQKAKIIKSRIFTKVFDVVSKTKLRKIIPEKSKKTGFRFFYHPIFFILRCFRVIVFFLPLAVIIYFAGNKFLTKENVIFLFIILGLWTLVRWAIHYISYRLNSFLVVENEGLFIFEFNGLFSLHGKNVSFDKVGVLDLLHKGFLTHFFDLGTLLISSVITAKSETLPKIILRNIYAPERALKLIKEARERYENSNENSKEVL